jgi:tetratricopeptide (TPR) repeat protein
MAGLTIMYVVLLGQRGVLMLTQPSLIAKLLGFFILILPVFGFAFIAIELRFGVCVERLAKQVEAEDRWPIRDLPLRPSGRPEKAAAQKEFERIRQELDLAPQDWHSWFNLGLAYDACGDRKRARAAMRKALNLKATASKS